VASAYILHSHITMFVEETLDGTEEALKTIATKSLGRKAYR